MPPDPPIGDTPRPVSERERPPQADGARREALEAQIEEAHNQEVTTARRHISDQIDLWHSPTLSADNINIAKELAGLIVSGNLDGLTRLVTANRTNRRFEQIVDLVSSHLAPHNITAAWNPTSRTLHLDRFSMLVPAEQQRTISINADTGRAEVRRLANRQLGDEIQTERTDQDPAAVLGDIATGVRQSMVARQRNLEGMRRSIDLLAALAPGASAEERADQQAAAAFANAMVSGDVGEVAQILKGLERSPRRVQIADATNVILQEFGIRVAYSPELFLFHVPAGPGDGYAVSINRTNPDRIEGVRLNLEYASGTRPHHAVLRSGEGYRTPTYPVTTLTALHGITDAAITRYRARNR